MKVERQPRAMDGTDAGGDRTSRRSARQARELEELGYDGVLTAETSHDPFLPLVVAAEHTERVELGTGIAVAFARNPMTLANIGHDLQTYSKGRFRLGLGSQIKPHIEKRFSMPWSHPAARMRELILAMRAIWARWNDGEKLDFRGEFYRHTLMTPFFNPGPNPYGDPEGVPRGGRRADDRGRGRGRRRHDHPRLHDRAVRARGHAARRSSAASRRRAAPAPTSRSRGRCSSSPARTTRSWRAPAQATKQQIAFYGSTPAYRRCSTCTAGASSAELNRLSKQGEWVEMGELIDDDDPRHVRGRRRARGGRGARCRTRYGDIVDRILFSRRPVRKDPQRWRSAIAEFHT